MFYQWWGQNSKQKKPDILKEMTKKNKENCKQEHDEQIDKCTYVIDSQKQITTHTHTCTCIKKESFNK